MVRGQAADGAAQERIDEPRVARDDPGATARRAEEGGL